MRDRIGNLIEVGDFVVTFDEEKRMHIWKIEQIYDSMGAVYLSIIPNNVQYFMVKINNQIEKLPSDPLERNAKLLLMKLEQ